MLEAQESDFNGEVGVYVYMYGCIGIYNRYNDHAFGIKTYIYNNIYIHILLSEIDFLPWSLWCYNGGCVRVCVCVRRQGPGTEESREESR